MPVVSKCFHCGHEFRSYAINVTNGTNIGLYGNTEQCPRCGWMANIMDGEFDFDEAGQASIIRAPQWTRQTLLRVQGQVREAHRRVSRGDSPQDVARDLEAALISDMPEAAIVVETAKFNFRQAFTGPTSMALAAWIPILIAIIMMFMASSSGISDEQLERILEEHSHQYPLPEAPEPATPMPSEQPPAPESEPPVLEA